MNLDIVLVFIILAAAVVLLITDWIRVDIVALLVLGSLALTGLLTPAEALSGFSNPAVVTVWAVLILSGALARTGVASWIGGFVLRLAGDDDVRLLGVIMISAGVLSGFMNSIGVTSLYLPVVVDIARRTDRPPSRLLIPLAFASLLGGLTTLIGTPSNLLISEALRSADLRAFAMFDFTLVGLTILLVGTIFMLTLGRHLLPERDIVKEFSSGGGQDIKQLYDLQERMTFLKIPAESKLDGTSLAESHLGSALGLTVLAVIRKRETHLAPDPEFILRAGDKVLVEGRMGQWEELSQRNHLELEDQELALERLLSEEFELAKVKVKDSSPWTGRTLRQVDFWQQYKVSVLAIQQGEEIKRTKLGNVTLREGDLLLVQGRREQMGQLKNVVEMTIVGLDEIREFDLEKRLMIVHIPEDSTLDGKTLVESRLGDAFGLEILGIVRQGDDQLQPDTETRLQAGDVLLVKGKEQDLQLMDGLGDLELVTQQNLELDELETEKTGLLEVILSPHSSLEGSTLRDLNFRTRYGVNVLAIWRGGKAYRSNLREMELRFGDALLLFGPHSRLHMMGGEDDFLVLSEKVQEPPRSARAPAALGIMALVLLPAILGWVPIAISAVVGVALMVITGCLKMDEAYRLIEWQAVFLIAGMLPLGIALAQTGAASYLGEGMVTLIGGWGPLAVMGGLFGLALLGSQVIPNPAVAVLLAPIALSASSELGVSPYSFMMAVAISSSASFLTPVGHPANLLVMAPGGYRNSDYVKVGLPLTLLVMLVAMLLIPVIWPL